MDRSGNQDVRGAVLVTVLLVTLVLVAVGGFLLIAVDRDTETRVSYTKGVAGFYAAEAGINQGAADARSIFLAFGVPAGTDCAARTLPVNERTVTYALSGCGQTPSVGTVLPGAFEGLTAIRYVYDVRSEAANAAGFREAVLRLRFEVLAIPMFQLLAFYGDDLELTPGPETVAGGRIHSNKDIYLNDNRCEGGLRVLGQITLDGTLYRGRKDVNPVNRSGIVRIEKPNGSLRYLGPTYIPSPGEDRSCPDSIRRRAVTDREANEWGGRIQLGVSTGIPKFGDLLCAPWSCPQAVPAVSPGTYWQRADLRIVLNATRTEKLVPAGPGPFLYALEVYGADGSLDPVLTARLKQFAQDVPGGITYSDVPKTPPGPACVPGTTACELNYKDREDYATRFPDGSPGSPDVNGCTVRRGPAGPGNNGARVPIDATNYCNDYRYGGFYNWRERKPILLLNIDWMKLEEWNFTKSPGEQLFDPKDSDDGGLVVYLSVRGPNSGYVGTQPIVNNYGVRLYNAQRLRKGVGDPDERGVTFASDQAVYIMGNFNCRAPDADDENMPAACGGNGKKPASVVADTINALSCAWIDSNPTDGSGPCRNSFNNGVNQGGPDAYRPLDERSTNARRVDVTGDLPDASQTFMNAALLAGTDQTMCPGHKTVHPESGWADPRRDGACRDTETGANAGAEYDSGGIHNYPRFHEDWRDKRFWYEGSFVALDAPKHTCFTYNSGLTGRDDPGFTCRAYTLDGKYVQGYRWMQGKLAYFPPDRRWFYDVSFDDVANLPPLSPRFIALRQEFFTEEFR